MIARLFLRLIVSAFAFLVVATWWDPGCSPFDEVDRDEIERRAHLEWLAEHREHTGTYPKKLPPRFDGAFGERTPMSYRRWVERDAYSLTAGQYYDCLWDYE